MIYDSPYPEITVPETTVSELVLGGAAERFGDRVALIDGHTGERFTYAELCEAVRSAAAGFAELGVRPGDTVAVMSYNQPRFAVAAHAALTAGVAVTTINPVSTADEVAKQLMAAKVCAVVSSEEAVSRASDAAAVAGVKHVLSFGNSARPFDELLHTGAGVRSPRLDPATAVAVLPFSSGTTGKSKGVQLTHRNLVANLTQSRAVWPIGPDDVVVAVPPFFHILGFTMVLNFSLLSGATVVTLARFELEEFLGVVKRHGATRGYFVPPMLLAIASSDHLDLDGGTSLKYGVCGAAPVDADIVARAEQRLGCVIRQG
ncbi:AMP-binding protein, partial [Mycolicibacterium sp. 120266]|uniref:AMP-binding protein n=1 Tax=Mycolicibacterium sp. 120266 TaxID=3090601 RepID=UPI00299E3320